MSESKKGTLTLKWGTLKYWDFEGNEEAEKLLQEYVKLGRCLSVALQEDTKEQKEIICKLIDLVDGDIYLDWDSKYISKGEAKDYVLNYRK